MNPLDYVRGAYNNQPGALSSLLAGSTDAANVVRSVPALAGQMSSFFLPAGGGQAVAAGLNTMNPLSQALLGPGR